MDIIGKIFSGLYELFISLLVGLFNIFISLLAGLFDTFKPLFIVAIIVIVIVVAVHVGKAMCYSNKEKRNEKKYISAMKAKYANRSKKELEEIYDYLMNLENCRKKAAKENANARSREEQESALYSSMAVTILEEQLGEKYPFIVYEYRHHDITYLKRLI